MLIRGMMKKPPQEVIGRRRESFWMVLALIMDGGHSLVTPR
jgi:hypothetical protein